MHVLFELILVTWLQGVNVRFPNTNMETECCGGGHFQNQYMQEFRAILSCRWLLFSKKAIVSIHLFILTLNP